jgi:hypothetical protein
MDVATSNCEWKIASLGDPPSLHVADAASNVIVDFSVSLSAIPLIVGKTRPTTIVRRSIKGPIQ